MTPLQVLLTLLLSIAPWKALAQINNAGTLSNDNRLARFVELMNRAGVSAAQARTIFAPTTDAFRRVRDEDPQLWTQYTTLPQFFVHMREIIDWHLVTEDAYTTNQIFNGRRDVLENAIGNLTVYQSTQQIDNIARGNIIDADITTSQGIVHVLDDVIIPPYMAVNLIEHMLNREFSVRFAYTTMAQLALFTELDDYINGRYERGITFLVPPNRRFNRARVDVPTMLTPEMKEYTAEFVKAHIIMDNYHEAGIFAFNQEQNQDQFLVTSELGTHLWISTRGGRLRFQSREVLWADRLAQNGIFHVVDLPLFPPFITDFTEFTALSTEYDTSDCFRFFRQSLLWSSEISKQFNSSLTMFCPSRDAFAQFNRLDFNRLLEPIWVRHATEFLLNHISMPALTREELVERAPSMITMLNGQEYELRRSGDRPRIANRFEQARSEFGDLIAVDGYLHLIDTAITPTAVSRSVYDQCNENPDFSLLVINIDFVQLTNMIDQDLPLTMLAPDNTAFRRIEFNTLGGGEIIQRHLFEGLLFCDVIANRTNLVPVEGPAIGVELRGEPGSGEWGVNKQNLYVGGAFVYECDILARNGVLHHVDRVIGEDYDTVSPTVSPQPTVTPQPTAFVVPTPAPQGLADTPTAFSPIALPPILPRDPPTVATSDQDQVRDAAHPMVVGYGNIVLSLLCSIPLLVAVL